VRVHSYDEKLDEPADRRREMNVGRVLPAVLKPIQAVRSPRPERDVLWNVRLREHSEGRRTRTASTSPGADHLVEVHKRSDRKRWAVRRVHLSTRSVLLSAVELDVNLYALARCAVRRGHAGSRRSARRRVVVSLLRGLTDRCLGTRATGAIEAAPSGRWSLHRRSIHSDSRRTRLSSNRERAAKALPDAVAVRARLPHTRW
jgi:hypothetical protein